MIKKNNKDVGFVYKGTQVIDKIYKGTDLVFEQGYTREQTGVPPITTTYQAIGKNLKDYKIYGNSIQGKLPSEYQQVEYIESTGTQYIDTGINVNTTTSRYETKINPSLVSGTMGIFGTRNYISSNSSSMNVFIINGAFRLDWLTGAGDYSVNNISSNTEYTISITRGLATINNVDYTSAATTSIDGSYTFYVGNFNNAGSVYSNGFSGKIYYSKLYNNNILVFDGVPCYRKSDNVIGMYDLVTNTFFTNAGTGVFLKGNSVQEKLPDTYQEVEYIESTGTQYIDTGITPDTTLEFDTTFNTSNNFSQETIRYGCIFGSRISSAKADVQLTTYSEFGYKGTIRWGNNYGDNAWLSNNVKINAKLKNNMYYVDNTEIRSTTIEVSNDYNIYIFALNQSGTAIQHGKLKLYTFKLWKNDVLVRDFIPCYRKLDNVIGMYDLVTNTFFTNAGTGVFLKGSNAPTPTNPVEIESVGDKTKNLFDYKTVYEPYIDSNGNISTTANVLASWNYFAETDVGKTITVSLYVGSISASYIRVQGQIDGSYITGNAINAGSKGYTKITVTPTSTSDRWRIIYGAGTPDVVLNQVMVAVSATRKDYEPYGYKIPVIVKDTNNTAQSTINIYLDEPLRKIGEYSDYIDFKNSKVVRNIAKKVLNGTEDWTMPGTIISDYSSYRIVNFIPNLPLQTPIEELLCTHFEAFPKSQYQQEPIQNKITSYGNTNQIIILVSNNIADSNNQTTTANWINWLSNNNITLYYSKQPTEETVALPNIRR